MEADMIHVPGITCYAPEPEVTPIIIDSFKDVKDNGCKFIPLQYGYPKLIFHDVKIYFMGEINHLAQTFLLEANIETAEDSIFRLVRAVKNYQDNCGRYTYCEEAYHCDIIIECDQNMFDAFMEKRHSLRHKYKLRQAIDMVSCRNCHFLYRAKDYRMPVICYWCSGDHTPQDCTVTDPICQKCKF